MVEGTAGVTKSFEGLIGAGLVIEPEAQEVEIFGDHAMNMESVRYIIRAVKKFGRNDMSVFGKTLTTHGKSIVILYKE